MLFLFTPADFMQAGAWTVSPAVPSDNCVLVKLTSRQHVLSFHDVIMMACCVIEELYGVGDTWAVWTMLQADMQECLLLQTLI